MELALNLVWVFVAIAGILVQIVMLSRSARSSDERVRPLRKAVAMGCALVILFFVISMTDDLHDQVLVWEESKHSRISAGAKSFVQVASDRAISFGFLAPIPSAPLRAPSQAWSGLAVPCRFEFLPAVARKTFGGRAPPASLI